MNVEKISVVVQINMILVLGLNCFSIKKKINLKKTTLQYIGTRDEEEIYEP